MRGDFARVSQILSNLINNAAKYTPQRRPHLAVRGARRRRRSCSACAIRASAFRRNSSRTIFEPFTQVDRTLARSHGGLGIGLTLVRRLVEMQGGTRRRRAAKAAIAAASSPCACRLAAVRAADAACRARPREPPSPAGLRVLVVDDNRDVADSTASVMRMNGCDVHVAYDGKAAIESVQRLQPDAVLLDIGLPTIDGYLVAEHIRAQPENGRTMIVAVSGYGQEQDRVRSKSVGFDYHVVKPIDPTVLAGLVGSLRLSRDGARGEAPRCPVAEHGDLTAPPSSAAATSNRSAIPHSHRRRSPSSPSGRSRAPPASPAIEGNAVRLLCDARENFRRGARRIAAAQRYILFESYIVEDDAIGREFAALLAERARAGVDVHVIVDWLGCWRALSLWQSAARRRCATCACSIRRGCRARSAGCRATIARRSSSTATSASSAAFASASAGSAIRSGGSSRGATPASRSAARPSRRSSRRSSHVFARLRRSARRDDPHAAGQRSRRRARCGCT